MALGDGLVSMVSRYTAAETLERLKGLLTAKGIALFVVIDHSGEAAQAGLEMPNTKVAIFGNPKAGTPLMVATPSLAIDLPMKILIAEDAAGQVRVTYNQLEYLRDRHGVPAELMGAIAGIRGIAEFICGD